MKLKESDYLTKAFFHSNLKNSCRKSKSIFSDMNFKYVGSYRESLRPVLGLGKKISILVRGQKKSPKLENP